MSLDINLTNVQSKAIVVSANQTAENDGNYTVVANATFTDPSPIEGKGYRVFVRNGTAVIGGFSYGAKTLVFRVFHSGSWSNVYYLDYVTIDSNFQTKINLSTNVNTDQASDSKYPSVKAVFDWATNLFFPKPTGTTAQYLRGDGTVATFPTIPDPADFVEKSDFTSHSILAKQSGAGDPVAVSIGNNEILGRKSGNGSDIEGLSVSEVKSLLGYTASDVGAVATNSAITGATKTKITYDAKGLVTAGADATTADIADSLDKRYVTDANLVVIGNTSGTNNGDNIAIIGGSQFTNSGTGGSERFIHPYTAAVGTQENVRQIVIPCSMTISNFFIQTGNSQSATGSHVLTLRKNGVDTSVQITIPAGSAAGVFSDTANSATFAAGDLLGIRMINNASASAAQIQSISFSN